MESYDRHRITALKKIVVADHILYVTYPLTNDPKILKLVIKNIYEAIEESMTFLYKYEKKPMHKNFELMLSKIDPLLNKYGISTEYEEYINEINEIVNFEKKSALEFVRNKKFVFATNEYDLSILSLDKVKDYLLKGKLFVRQVTGVIK